MKNNYLNNRFKSGLKALAFLCVFGYTNANAQTVVTAVISAVAPGESITPDTGQTFQTYATDAVIKMTNTAVVYKTIGGEQVVIGSFDVSFDVTPKAGQAISRLAAWGVNQTYSDYPLNTVLSIYTGPTFRAAAVGPSFASVGNISFSNFNGGVSAASIQSSTFKDIVVGIANNTADRFAYQIGTTEYVPGKLAADPTTVDLLALPGISSLSAFDIKTVADRVSVSDRWAINSISIAVTLDDTTLGVNDFASVSNSKLIVSPNPVVDVLSLNMPIQSAEIIDVTGRTVKSFNGETSSLDLSSIVSGTYILKASTLDGKVLTTKIIK